MKRTNNLAGRPKKQSDRALRTMIFKQYANADISANVQVQSMQLIFEWIKGGKTPLTAEKLKPQLVAKND